MIGYHEPLCSAGGGVTELNKGYKRRVMMGTSTPQSERSQTQTHTHTEPHISANNEIMREEFTVFHLGDVKELNHQ